MTGPGKGGIGSQNINSDDVSNAFYTAANDKDVKAIVFRLSSPGGSDTASEQILAAVRAAKAKKPVVVSMGAYGASGGYWISSEASAIVAEPTTLTGSIGVFGGKLAIGPALAHFGVDMPVFAKRRFQHGAIPLEGLRRRLGALESDYRRQYLATYQ